MENKSLQVKKDNILKRIVNFISSLFKLNKSGTDERTTTDGEIDKKVNFMDEIKIQKEAPELIELQEKFENGEIDLENLSNEEVHNLNLLYDRQLVELENELIVKKTELNVMRDRLDNLNTNT